ncbi:isoprenylcysteine carboxyl methyltransferase family protein [Subtercola endophyticus]|uniref:isoprenylcysteine carboxyl methyltransferase family protein n=1 Tax=Subtercola endophyticus TaxID=2895559 RepID=UPI001E4925B1|nr:isoprenylcysteine carboxyl methyltransferase family protein [Subtercola endophyticus]UFS60948.1 isoprenylcysteine carboxyl methyltransferase family protein [Subtercola endophyticus]
MLWYAALILATGAERFVELGVSSRNAAWAFKRGGVEFGKRHFAFMVCLHTGMLLACLAEVFLLNRTFTPWLGYPMLVIALASQALRWWCIATLGKRWNTRVIVVPGLPLVDRGPYRFFNHPNYVAVIAEGIALPLVYNAYITATVFTVINLVLLLRFRIPVEERALAFGLAQAPDARAGA